MRRLLDNFGAAVVGYLAASIAAGFSYTFILAAAIQVTGAISEPSELSALAQFQGLIWFAVLASLLIAAVAFVPALPVVVALLLARRTDVISYIVAGIAIGVASVVIARHHVIFMDKLEVDWVIVSAAAIAGIVFGLGMRKMAPGLPA